MESARNAELLNISNRKFGDLTMTVSGFSIILSLTFILWTCRAQKV